MSSPTPSTPRWRRSSSGARRRRTAEESRIFGGPALHHRRKPAAFNVEVDGESYLVKVAPAGISVEAAEPKAPKDGVTVPMQGVVIRYLVSKGDQVNKGDVVAVLEAMKMENDVYANKDGVVAEIYAEVGATVSPGDILMSIS